MSYRAFKHLLGETSLERKCRFIFGGSILILITGSFYWYAHKSEEMVYQQHLNTCRVLVNPILLRHHWEHLETLKDFVRSIGDLDQAFRELAPEDARHFKSRFIHPDVPTRLPMNDFESDALMRFSKGESDEAFRFVPGEDMFQYLAAVRLKESCLVCHPALERADPPRQHNVGDLRAAVSIALPMGRTRQEIQQHRLLLFGMAAVTALVGMGMTYVIVRYIIVKPVKHLKDVSDAVSGGNIDVRADIQTRDDFEELCHAFNRMVRNLVAMQEELRGVNRELDRKVDQLAQANMALFESNRLKSDFLTTMSHELRTPLNSIIGFSELLSSSNDLSDKERRFATNIQKSGKMLLALINDILDLAKIEAGRVELHPEDFSVSDIVEGLVTMARPIAEHKNIRLDTQIDPAIPLVYQDIGKMQQILYNLLSNAIKFTPQGGRVTVSARAADPELIVAVADTGVGIAAEDHDRIFEKFRQGARGQRGMEDLLTREHSGTGLGLSIVRELCHMMGGEITLQSELGKGSTFTVRVPLRLPHGPTFQLPLSDGRVDLSKARRVDAQLLASASSSPG